MEKTADNADNVLAKWVLSVNMTLCFAENALEKVPILLDSPKRDDCTKHVISTHLLY
jgi:hypothetical protein